MYLCGVTRSTLTCGALVASHSSAPPQGSQMAMFYPFYSRANDVIFFESKWDKMSPPGNPAPPLAKPVYVRSVAATHSYGFSCFEDSATQREGERGPIEVRSLHKHRHSRTQEDRRRGERRRKAREPAATLKKNLAVRRYCVQYISVTPTWRDGYPSSRTATVLDYGT